MSRFDGIAPTPQAKKYLVALHKLLRKNVPEELGIYVDAANDLVFNPDGTVKDCQKALNIADMGLKPETGRRA